MECKASIDRRRLLALASAAWLPGAAWGEPDEGGVFQASVELSAEWRRMAAPGGGRSKVDHAQVTVARPPGFDAGVEWPVLVVNATSDRGNHSSRALMQAYRTAAADAGWVIAAADPAPEVDQRDDQLGLRYVLSAAALAVVRPMWKGADRPRVAFAGFSGGAKYSGWLGALFHKQGASVAGAYLAGMNVNAISEAVQHFGLGRDEGFHRLPVFLQGGLKDRVATPAQHEAIADELKREGFGRVRLEFVPGPHAVDASLLAGALRWFASSPPAASSASDAGR